MSDAPHTIPADALRRAQARAAEARRRRDQVEKAAVQAVRAEAVRQHCDDHETAETEALPAVEAQGSGLAHRVAFAAVGLFLLLLVGLLARDLALRFWQAEADRRAHVWPWGEGR